MILSPIVVTGRRDTENHAGSGITNRLGEMKPQLKTLRTAGHLRITAVVINRFSYTRYQKNIALCTRPPATYVKRERIEQEAFYKARRLFRNVERNTFVHTRVIPEAISLRFVSCLACRPPVDSKLRSMNSAIHRSSWAKHRQSHSR